MSGKQEGWFTLNYQLEYTRTVLWNSWVSFPKEKKGKNVVGKDDAVYVDLYYY